MIISGVIALAVCATSAYPQSVVEPGETQALAIDPAQPAGRLPSAEAVIDWAIEAHGGREAHDKLKAREIRGSYRQSDEEFSADVFIFQERPARKRTEIILFNGELLILGVNDETAWIDDGANARVFVEARERQARRAAAFDPLGDWMRMYERAEMAGIEELDGRPVRHVRLIGADGLETSLLFDAESRMLIARRENIVIDAERSYPQLTRYLDYKEVDGIRLPMKVTHTMGEGENARVITYTYSRVEHNKRLPRDAFESPPAVDAPQRDKPAGAP